MYALNIKGLTEIISEYIGKECKIYLDYVGVDYKYLYETYTEEDAVKYLQVRYLKIIHDVSKLQEYKNVIDLTFDDEFEQMAVE